MTTHRRLLAGVLIAGALAAPVAACSSDSTTSTDGTTAGSAATGELTVTDAWCREVPPTAETAGCYMIITNDSGTDDELTGVSVSSSVAGDAQIHETVMMDDTAGTAMDDTDDMTDGTAMDDTDDMDGDDDSTAEGAMDDMDDMTDGTAMDDMTDGTAMDDMEDMSGEGMMTMQEVSSIEIAAGETVRFEPGGYHIMLLELADYPAAGETVELELTFAEAGTKTVTFEVKAG